MAGPGSESSRLLDDALEQLAGGAPRWTEHDNLGLLCEEEAGAEDGDAALPGSCVSRGGGRHQHRAWERDLNVLPKRRGVLISTSPGHDSQPCFCMMRGFCTPQSSRYMTRADALKKFS